MVVNASSASDMGESVSLTVKDNEESEAESIFAYIHWQGTSEALDFSPQQQQY